MVRRYAILGGNDRVDSLVVMWGGTGSWSRVGLSELDWIAEVMDGLELWLAFWDAALKHDTNEVFELGIWDLGVGSACSMTRGGID